MKNPIKYYFAIFLAVTFFTTPFIYVTWESLSELQKKREFTKNEINGTIYHRELFKLLVTLHEKSKELYYSAPQDSATTKLSKQIAKVDKINNLYAEEINIKEKWLETKIALNKFQNRSKKLDAESSFLLLNEATKLVVESMLLVANKSSIILDPEASTYHLINTNVNILPGFFSSASTLIGRAQIIHAKNSGYSSELLEKTYDDTIKYSGNFEVYSSLLNSALNHEHEASRYLNLHIAKSKKELVAEQQWFLDSIHRISHNEKIYEVTTRGNEMLDVYSKLYESISHQLQITLEKRANKFKLNSIIILVSCAISVLAMSAILAFFYNGIGNRKKAEEKLKLAYADLERRVIQRTQELAVRNTQVEAARKEAEQANTLKRDFLANMSHEIRTPMNGIMGMAELLLETELNSKQEHYARTISYSSDALLEIINDILDFSKIEAGKLDFEIIPINLYFIIESTAEILAPKARERGLELIIRYANGTPRYMMGDPVRIRQLVSNLLSNAIKFTETGYVLVNVESAPVCDIDYEKHETNFNNLKISVQDTGIGISAEAQKKIFNKFTQADNSTTRKFGGTGLGLAICKQLVEMMGGEISLESELGKGSTFSFNIMLESSAEETLPFDDIKEFLAPLKDVRVLVVDDIAINLQVFEELLSSAGMSVTTTSSALEAPRIMANAKAAGTPYQIVIIDWLMPEMDGEELAIHIKSNPEIADVILIMTSSADIGDYADHFAQVGFKAILSKPVRAEYYIETIAAAFSAHKDDDNSAIISDDALVKRNKSILNDVYFKNTKILLVEDNKVNQEFALAMFSKIGIKTDLAENGKDAVEKARAEKYDLIFMDCQMPVMDGFEATKILKSLQGENKFENIPIIALTANAMKGDRERCMEAGMSDYISKPVKKEALIKMLTKWLPDKLSTLSSTMPKATQEASKNKSANVFLDERAFSEMRELIGDNLNKTINLFIKNTQKLIDDVEISLNPISCEQLNIGAHSIKSSAAYMGAEELGKVAKIIETKTTKSTSALNLTELNSLVDELKKVWSETEKIYKSYTA